MKRFWDLMVVALVMLGAAACTENEESIEAQQEAGLSFYAEIDMASTRVDLTDEDGDKVWETIWEGNETLIAVDNDTDKRYTFTNTEAEPNKFTCTDEGASELLGGSVTILSESDESNYTSYVGKKFLDVTATIENFDNTATISLNTNASFLRYTYNGEGVVAITMTTDHQVEANQTPFLDENMAKTSTVTFEGVKGENWVPFTPMWNDEGLTATLSYAIDGVKCKQTTISNVKSGKIYNLGTLTEPEAKVYLVPNVWDADGAWFTAYFFDAEGNNSPVTMTASATEGVYECSVPAGMEKVIFCRMNPEFTEFGWNTGEEAEGDPLHVWNQSADLEIGVEPDNYYYIHDWSVGVWGTESGYETPAPAAEWYVAGTHNGWSTTATPMALVGDYYVAYGVEFTAAGQFKVVDANNSWYGADALTVGAWTNVNTTAGDIAIAAGTYDFYFSKANTKLCVVEAGATVPEISSIVWALAGTFNSWGDLVMTSTDTANVFVAEGVELAAGSEIKVKDSTTWDTSFGAGVKYLETNKWMTVFHGSNTNITIAKSATYDVYFEYLGNDSKLYLMEVDTIYTTATEQTADGTYVPDEIEIPDEVTPGETSEWALVGAFSGWADKYFVTTTNASVVVLENVTMEAAQGFLVRKPSTEWNDKYGAGNVNYIKANHYITTSKGGVDMCLESAGTYDVYFNISTAAIYIMTAGTDYTTATEQTANGEEPKQEEPEVTDKVVYLKPNSNWTQANARFAAYFWNDSGNVWVSMTAVGDGTYQVNLPEGYDYGCNVIFCRMNPSTTANNWNNKWNQTSDLKTPTDGKNLYTVKDGTWDKGGGTWSVK